MRVVLFIFIFQLGSIYLIAQPNNTQPLIDAVTQFHTPVTGNDAKEMVSVFEKLASTTTGANAWIPSYYLAILYSRLSIKNKNIADSYADKAIYWANKSIASNPNDENYSALAMAKISKMAVNPVLRWVTYEKSIYAALNIAKKTNPNNPRIYILEGSLTLNKPYLFGGGCDKAKPILSKARVLMEQQIPQKLLPTWGRQHLEDLKKSCVFY